MQNEISMAASDERSYEDLGFISHPQQYQVPMVFPEQYIIYKECFRRSGFACFLAKADDVYYHNCLWTLSATYWFDSLLVNYFLSIEVGQVYLQASYSFLCSSMFWFYYSPTTLPRIWRSSITGTWKSPKDRDRASIIFLQALRQLRTSSQCRKAKSSQPKPKPSWRSPRHHLSGENIEHGRYASWHNLQSAKTAFCPLNPPRH